MDYISGAGQRQIEENVICITVKSKTELIKLASIRYFEGLARKTIVYADNGPHEFPRRLAEIEEMLDDRFVMCHKGFMINLQRVRRMTYTSFEFESEETVPIIQGRQKKAKEAILKFIGNNRRTAILPLHLLFLFGVLLWDSRLVLYEEV